MVVRVAPSRSSFEEAERTLLSRGALFKPAVWRVKTKEPCIVKDVSGIRLWRRGIARWLLSRERSALKKLEGIEGVPVLLGDLDRDAFAMGVLEGQPLDQAAFEHNPRARAEAMQYIIAQIHERQVYHLDLRQRQNVFYLGAEGIAICDFGAALAPGPMASFLFGWILVWVDQQAVLKFLARHAPQALTLAEAQALRRSLRLRRFWFVSPHQDRGERAAVRLRIEELQRRSP